MASGCPIAQCSFTPTNNPTNVHALLHLKRLNCVRERSALVLSSANPHNPRGITALKTGQLSENPGPGPRRACRGLALAVICFPSSVALRTANWSGRKDAPETLLLPNVPVTPLSGSSCCCPISRSKTDLHSSRKKKIKKKSHSAYTQGGETAPCFQTSMKQ